MRSLCSIIFVLLVITAEGRGNNISIGGLFHTRFPEEERVFSAAVSEVNAKNVLGDHTLQEIREFVPEMNTFQVGRAVCRFFLSGVTGVFGPQSRATAGHVQSLCDSKEVPHIETRWDSLQRRGGCSVNLHPHPTSLTKTLLAVIQAWGWEAFTILYENELSLAAMGDLLKFSNEKKYSIMVRQLPKGDNYREVLRDIQKSSCNNVVLDCSLDILPEVLKQAQQVGLMIAEYSFIITNLDFHTVDVNFLMYGGTNITGFRMVKPDMTPSWLPNDSKIPMLMGSALLYDAVQLFAHALSSMSDTNITTTHQLSCSAEDSWAHGYTLINYMKASEIKGLTGLIKFDNEGFRSHFELDLIELTGDGLKHIGTWNSSLGLNLTRVPLASDEVLNDESVANRTFKVLISLTHPYGMLKEDSKKLSGNERYEGFGTDLIQELSAMLGFKYIFEVQEDNVYGSLNKKTKQWNGMLRRIIDGEADLGIADLTITHDREGAVDFTMPFMNLGIQILYRKPTKEAPSLFSFLSPFSNEVWMYVLGAYTGVSVLLFVMARISPYEWTNPYPCIEEPEVLENQFSLKNSLWFTIGSLMQQGSEIAPIAVSTRMVAGIWWFFTLIMVSSYTANLAAFLTVESTSSPFDNVRELANNDKGIVYGAKRDGSTFTFFNESKNPLYQKMGEFMTSHPDLLTSTNDDGVRRVKERTDYAFIMESTSIDYATQRNCELTAVGDLLDTKGYGIAMRKNSPYRNALSTGVLRLQENGRLTTLKDKWWKEKRGGGACMDDAGGGEAKELDLKNVGGVFVVLVAGVFIACFITIFEMLWSIIEVSRNDKVSFKHELIEELKFVAKCHGSTKPVRKRNGDEDEITDEAFEPLSPIVPFGGWFENNEKKSPLP